MQHDLEANRELVLRFYKEFVNDGDFSKEKEIIVENYKQHSTLAADGLSGLKEMIAWVDKEWPDRKPTFYRTVCEGDLVVVHAHLQRWPGDRGLAAIDIFRVENGKVVEHWDAIQEVPEKMKHDNGMF